jgi:hypothetical protein
MRALRPGLLSCAFLGLLALTGCDALDDGSFSVRGRVVDAVTGGPLAPGPAAISVTGASFLGLTETPLSGEADADGRFHLSGPIRDGLNLELLQVASHGRIEYPGADTSATGVLFGLGRDAYFHYQTGVPGRGDIGEVRLLPTCLTLGAVRLSRPLARSEQLRVTMVSVPEAPPTALLTATAYTYQGSPGEGEVPPDSLRLLSVGGRPARLDWEINQYNPPTGNGQGVFARGSVPIGTCPRHGVLRYAATIALPL